MNSEAEHDWCGVRALERAARACERRKRARPDSIAFRMKEGEELFALSNRLRSNTYWPKAGRVFVTERPKYRDVHAAVYRDRVVHHLLYALLEPIFEPTFSAASFACRKGKGTHAAVAHLQARMWALARHGGQRVFALSLDVSSAARVGRLHLFADVPTDKRMGALGPDRSLPIGNLTSQFFANFYLSPLDHFIARTLQIRGYAGYLDEFVLLNIDEQRLVAAHARVVDFLHERLHLALKAKPIVPVSEGVDFVGYIVRSSYLLPRRRVVQSFRTRLAETEQCAKAVVVRRGVRLGMPGLGSIAGPMRCTRVNENQAEQLRFLWASHQGHLAKASRWRLLEQLWAAHGAGHPILNAVSVRSGSPPFPVSSAQRQLPGPGATACRWHHALGRRQASSVGCADREVLRSALQRPAFWASALCWLGRRSWPQPVWFAHSLIQRVLRAGFPVTVAMADDELCGNVKRRRNTYLFEPWNDTVDKETA